MKTLLVVAVLAVAVLVSACQTFRTYPDGTTEETQLDPVAALLLGRVIDVASQVAFAKTPEERVEADATADRLLSEALDKLPEDVRNSAQAAIVAAREGDWAALMTALEELRDAQVKATGGANGS
jgi:hypothetical protein